MKASICFVSLNNYAVLSGDASVRHIGGAEVQQAHIARGLVARGHRVSFVTLDHGQPDVGPASRPVTGIRVYKAYRKDAGLRGLRFFHPRVTGLWAAMHRADAEVYYQRGIDLESGLVAAWCRRHGRKFVFALAHDSNCYHDLPSRHGWHERILCRYGLRQADRIISQTEFQRSVLHDEYGLDSTVIRSCAVDPLGGTAEAPRTAGPRRLLWVGRFSREKRLGLLLDLAERLPRLMFDVVGQANAESAEAYEWQERAQRMPNVTMHGYVPSARMGAFYAGAAALICTSLAEGFPNTFLEAWSRGVPVITTVDPDGLVSEHGLGLVIDSAAEATAAVGAFADDLARIEACGERARRHFVTHHGIASAVEAYEQVMVELIARRGRAPSAMHRGTTPMPGELGGAARRPLELRR